MLFRLVITWLFACLPALVFAEDMPEAFLEVSIEVEDKEYQEHSEAINDPFETVNRGVFALNKGVDKILIEPMARTYRTITPTWGRDRVENFMSNLYEPVTFTNYVLQGDAEHAASSIGRFLVNSTIGLLGFFDMASSHDDLKRDPTDFGLTLKSYGSESGPYLILPILGPSSVRDAVGKAIDYVIDPFDKSVVYKRIAYDRNKWKYKRYAYVRAGTQALVTRESLLDSLETVEETSFDEYAAIRSIYLQKRK